MQQVIFARVSIWQEVEPTPGLCAFAQRSHVVLLVSKLRVRFGEANNQSEQ
jgi:hypothetical protein